MRACPRAWLAWGLLCLSPGVQAVQLTPADGGLHVDERARLDRAIADVVPRLPAGLLVALPADVPVRVSDALPAHVAGRALAGVILLPRSLLIGSAPAAADALRSTLIHELMHVADRSADGGWSRSPRLRELAGWQRRVWKLGRGANHFTDRNPDAYERQSAAEYLAVNAEHWLLDAEFACRRPALAAWFSATFGAAPSQAAPCASTLPLVQASEEEGAVALMQLDPARVYAVDYLFAEGGRVPMSRWGHSMLRLVICREGRVPGPDCRLDLDQHRVLSFRAFVGDVELSSWRGLTGGYPSRLFVLPLQQVVDEYTKVELRGLASIPLRLTPAEISGLLERTAQVHWGYDGRYYFVSNNCAVETAKLLQAGVPALQERGIERISPRGLRRRLDRLGRLDETVLHDHAAAIRDGYYFPSSDRYFATLFAAARAEVNLPARDARGWINLAADQRAPWLQRGGLRGTAGLLLLEQAAFARAELRARDQLKHALLKQPDSEGARQLQALLEESGQWLRPAGLLAGNGYGLPQAAELSALQPALQDIAATAPDAWKRLRMQMRMQLPDAQRAELDALETNLVTLRGRLRDMSALPVLPAEPQDAALPLR